MIPKAAQDISEAIDSLFQRWVIEGFKQHRTVRDRLLSQAVPATQAL